MLSVGDLVWYRNNFRNQVMKEKGVGMVKKITRGEFELGVSIKKTVRYYVHWQQPGNFCFDTQHHYDCSLVKVISDV